MTRREDALDYHSRGRSGNIAVVPTKPLKNQWGLALAYTPGVAEPCLEIRDTPDDVYRAGTTCVGAARRSDDADAGIVFETLMNSEEGT